MKLSTTLLVLLGAVVLVNVADGLSNEANEEAMKLRHVLIKKLKAEKQATQLEATIDDNNVDENEEERTLLKDEDNEKREDGDLGGVQERVMDTHGFKYDRKPCPQQFAKLKYAPTCASRSPDFVKGGVSRRDKRMIVKLHNTLRGQVSPKASNMLKLSWDNDLALSAQHGAEKCGVRNSIHTCSEATVIPGKFLFGENLAWNYKSWEKAIYAWYNEKDDFEFGKGSINKKKVGHYTAMVWATTYKIGCGFAACKGRFGDEPHYVCQYGPAGNVADKDGKILRPYKSASASCGECKPKRSRRKCKKGKNCASTKCKKNLCVCPSRVCKETEMMDSKTCKCQQNEFQYSITPNCGR